jgi:hypothetical protein
MGGEGIKLLNLVAQASFGHNHRQTTLLPYRKAAAPATRGTLDGSTSISPGHTSGWLDAPRWSSFERMRPLHNGSVIDNVRQIVHTLIIRPSSLATIWIIDTHTCKAARRVVVAAVWREALDVF